MPLDDPPAANVTDVTFNIFGADVAGCANEIRADYQVLLACTERDLRQLLARAAELWLIMRQRSEPFREWCKITGIARHGRTEIMYIKTLFRTQNRETARRWADYMVAVCDWLDQHGSDDANKDTDELADAIRSGELSRIGTNHPKLAQLTADPDDNNDLEHLGHPDAPTSETPPECPKAASANSNTAGLAGSATQQPQAAGASDRDDPRSIFDRASQDEGDDRIHVFWHSNDADETGEDETDEDETDDDGIPEALHQHLFTVVMAVDDDDVPRVVDFSFDDTDAIAFIDRFWQDAAPEYNPEWSDECKMWFCLLNDDMPAELTRALGKKTDDEIKALKARITELEEKIATLTGALPPVA